MKLRGWLVLEIIGIVLKVVIVAFIVFGGFYILSEYRKASYEEGRSNCIEVNIAIEKE